MQPARLIEGTGQDKGVKTFVYFACLLLAEVEVTPTVFVLDMCLMKSAHVMHIGL